MSTQETLNYKSCTQEERKAWDLYAANLLPLLDGDTASVALIADRMLVDRRKRFNLDEMQSLRETGEWVNHYGDNMPKGLMPEEMIEIEMRSGAKTRNLATKFDWTTYRNDTGDIMRWRFIV